MKMFFVLNFASLMLKKKKKLLDTFYESDVGPSFQSRTRKTLPQKVCSDAHVRHPSLRETLVTTAYSKSRTTSGDSGPTRCGQEMPATRCPAAHMQNTEHTSDKRPRKVQRQAGC